MSLVQGHQARRTPEDSGESIGDEDKISNADR